MLWKILIVWCVLASVVLPVLGWWFRRQALNHPAPPAPAFKGLTFGWYLDGAFTGELLSSGIDLDNALRERRGETGLPYQIRRL